MNKLFELIKNNDLYEIEKIINISPKYLYLTNKLKIEEYKENFGYIELYKNISLEKYALINDKIEIYNFLQKKKKENLEKRIKNKRNRSLSPSSKKRSISRSPR